LAARDMTESGSQKRQADNPEEQKKVSPGPDLGPLNDLALSGSAPKDLPARIRSACWHYLAERKETEACQAVLVMKVAASRNRDLLPELFGAASLTGTIAYKEGMQRLGDLCGDMIAEALTGAEGDALEKGCAAEKNLLSAAVRQRGSSSFEEACGKIAAACEKMPYKKPLADLLLSLMFMAADRRKKSALIQICRALRRLLTNGAAEDEAQSALLEMLSVSSQMGQRRWQDEARAISSEICLYLAKKGVTDLFRRTFSAALVQMQLLARTEDEKTAFETYLPWQVLMLFLSKINMRRYIRGTEDKKEEALSAVSYLCAAARDNVTCLARLEAKNESKVYNAWHAFLQETIKRRGRKKHAALFMQMAALFWRETMPRSSRGQWDDMSPLMHPLLVTGRYREILDKI